MEFLDILGYLGALVIGITLGLIGGGGSILTVPVLVYLLNYEPVTATAYSLFVVGASALVGGIKNHRLGLVNLKTAAIFAVPSLTAVFLTRRFLVPAIPEKLFSIGSFEVDKGFAIMVFFALIMLVAAISMIKNGSRETVEEAESEPSYNFPLIFLEGLGVGLVTGIVGAGGGFLIIPALVLLAKLPMKMAVGTSLLIIAVKSLGGFTGDILAGTQIDWVFLLSFTAVSVIGIFLGILLSKKIPGKSLKMGFGWFVLVMACVIITKEIRANPSLSGEASPNPTEQVE